MPRLTLAAYRRLTLVALAAVAFIIVTGGAVRLTGSGLGCPDWPTCDAGALAPDLHGPTGYHGLVEFVNRTVTGLVSIAVALAVLGSLRLEPRRRDLTLLSWGLVAGVAAQVVLGGITVLTELSPPTVMAHFLLSMVLVANAVVLHHRAGGPDAPARPIVAPEVRTMGGLLIVAASVAIFSGTIVTGAGPHGGDENVRRLDFFVPDVARLHGIAVMLFAGAVLATLWLLHRTGAPRSVRRNAEILLIVLAAQAAVGYTQYFTGVPVLLVGVHIAGSVAVWIAVLGFHLGLRARSWEDTDTCQPHPSARSRSTSPPTTPTSPPIALGS